MNEFQASKSCVWLLVLQLIFLLSSMSYEVQSSESCGYTSCDKMGVKQDLINVHLVPHTHDDVGWLKTVDQYFYGANNSIQLANVQLVIDSVMDYLQKDPEKRFTYVEIAFFWRWWKTQSDAKKEIVKQLVNEGRLVFANGGWCMNDEGATHYNAIIDQMTLGMRFLNETFGECGRPQAAWHVDPFGHSKEQANLFGLMGFDSFFFARIDYADERKRKAEKRMEEVWKAGVTDIFTGVLFSHYYPPKGFNWELDGGDEPIMDDPDLEGYNVDRRVDEFLVEMKTQSKSYRTNHIMVTMGGDFHYKAAGTYYDNMDKLIKYTNQRQANGSQFNLVYSTPNCYTYHLNKANITWSIKTDDFFPYASSPQSYWTGYFTSRPTHKGFMRFGNNVLQVCKQFEAISQVEADEEANVRVLQEAMAVVQHHDSITGTAKQHVADDYAKRVSEGIMLCQNYTKKVFHVDADDVVFCPYGNVSVCPFTTKSSENFSIVVYNPLARPISVYVTLPVSQNYTIVLSDVAIPNCIKPIAEPVKVARGPRGNASYELTFEANLKGLGVNVYTAIRKPFNSHFECQHNYKYQNNIIPSYSPQSISNKFYKLELADSGLTSRLTNHEGVSIDFTQQLMWYNCSVLDGKNNTEPPSGAYVFRPFNQTPFPISPSGRIHSTVIVTPVVSEVRQTFSPWASQIIRLYANKPFLEIEWLVGPIPVNDSWAKEIISHFSTNLASKSTFYTDANGRQILKRKRNYRPTWNLTVSEPTSGNYYPVNSRIFIRDNNLGLQLTVLTDRSQGGSSLRDGELEVMLHRRDLKDDGFGVGEALNETGQFGEGLIARGKIRITLEPIAKAAKVHRLLAEEMFMAPLIAYAKSPIEIDFAKNQNISLPPNIHILTLEKIGKSELLLRLEHQFAEDEDEELSLPVTVDVKSLFAPLFSISSMRELSLAGNTPLDSLRRLTWETTKGSTRLTWSPLRDGSFQVDLKPMMIRTFKLYLN